MIVEEEDPRSLHSLQSEQRNIIFNQENNVIEKGMTRWIFTDIPQKTLKDEWGNVFDHQVHNLLAGSLQDGLAFLESLATHEFHIQDAPALFVPFQTLDPGDVESSDSLRSHHPRAFALARRERPNLKHLLTIIRDEAML